MRTNIDIDDEVLEAAMKAGAFKTKKDAVEAGLKLLARQAAYREILRWEGKLQWDGDDAAALPAAGVGRTPGLPLLAQAPEAKPPVRKQAQPGVTAKVRHARR